jgi:hypothetical protein
LFEIASWALTCLSYLTWSLCVLAP